MWCLSHRIGPRVAITIASASRRVVMGHFCRAVDRNPYSTALFPGKQDCTDMISFWAVQARAAHRPEAVVRALERKMLVLSAAGSLQR